MYNLIMLLIVMIYKPKIKTVLRINKIMVYSLIGFLMLIGWIAVYKLLFGAGEVILAIAFTLISTFNIYSLSKALFEMKSCWNIAVIYVDVISLEKEDVIEILKRYGYNYRIDGNNIYLKNNMFTNREILLNYGGKK